MRKYVVVRGGEIVFASDSEEEAEEYANQKMDEAIDEAAEEMGIEADDVDQVWRAQYQAGYDGEVYETVEIDTDNFDEDGEMEVILPSDEEVTLYEDDLERLMNE
jgi:hypothetical protein